MAANGNEKAIVVTQVSIGGFDRNVTAKKLMTFLEDTIGLVWRCRVKTSWTPPESFPDYEVDKVGKGPYPFDSLAFVHFASPESVKKALEVAGRNELILDGKVLIVSCQEPINQIGRTQYKFPGVHVDLGFLDSPDDFVVAWKADSVVEFLVDPFDSTCKFLLAKDITFSNKDDHGRIIIKCDFKIEFLAGNINVFKVYKGNSSWMVLIQLASSPLLYYRTADDDIEVSVPFDTLDDDDPWIQTTDFTSNGAFRHCNTFKVSLSPRYGSKLEKAVHYLQNCRVLVENHVMNEPA